MPIIMCKGSPWSIKQGEIANTAPVSEMNFDDNSMSITHRLKN